MAVARSLDLVRSESTLSRIKHRLPSYFSDFREDPSWLPMFLLARTTLGRRYHWRKAEPAPPKKRTAPSLFDLDERNIVQTLRQDGIYTGFRLPAAMVGEIQRFADETGCFGNHDRRLDLRPAEHMARQADDNPVLSGHYFERIEQCPAIMSLQKDPLLEQIALSYLGGNVKISSTRLWWTFPNPAVTAEKAAPREMLHFDLDDWRTIKFFFYLTPVDAGSGPHLYVRGSHDRHIMRHQLSLTVGRPAPEVLDAYGPDNLITVSGDAGLGFVEDSYGFHAGRLAHNAPRLMLEIGFGIRNPNRRRFYSEQVL